MKLSSPATDGRRATKNAANTAALLRAAAATFAERGFEAATMDQIAERAGLSKGALYYRYKSKEDLFIALLDERCEAYMRELDAAFAGDAPAQAGWLTMAERFRAVVENEEWPRLFFEFVSYASRSARARRALAARTRALRAALARVIERQALEAAVELPVPAEQIALGISALCNGLAVERLADREVPDSAFAEIPALLLWGAAAGGRARPAARATRKSHHDAKGR